MDKHQDLYGVGLYTIAESSRYSRVSSSRIKRWLYGYEYDREDKKIEKPSIWEAEIKIEDSKTLSFRDLLEVRAIGLFLKEKISLQKIRKAKEILEKRWDEKYPFSSGRIQTDGLTLYKQHESPAHSDQLVEIFSMQENMEPIIKQSIINIDFEGIKPVRWWISGKEKKILLDPNRSFGAPLEAESGIPTFALNDVFESTKDYGKTAMYFDIEADCVQRAVEFESSLRRQNASFH